MKFAIRVDDVGWSTEETASPPIKKPDPELSLARRFHEAMGGLPYLAAVIPAALDDVGVAWLRSRPKGLTFALHGWDHSMSHGERSEFYRVPLGEIRLRLRMGMIKVHETKHVVPPFNAVDPDLPAACRLEGVRAIWGAPEPLSIPIVPCSDAPGVCIVPGLASLYGPTLVRTSPDQTPILPEVERMKRLPGKAVITLHLTWEAAKTKNFDGVKKLVELVGSCAVTPDDYLEMP